MGASVGSLNVDLSIGTARFKQGLSDAQAQLKGFQSRVDGIGSKLQGFGAALSIGVTAPLIALGASSIKAANESKAAFAQVEASLTSMGNASGRSMDQLQALSGRLQDKSLFDDDDIMKKSTANLLTFSKINGDVFDRAQQAIVDYAAKTGTDLQPATIMIGKALQDPVKGIAALSRVGIKFTEDQKAMIGSMVAAGDVAGAQGVVLKELETQYKGSAAAARAASPTAETEQAWRTFQETVGAVAVKVLPPLTGALTAVLDGFNKLDPGTQNFIVVAGGILAAVGPVVGTLGTLTRGFAAVAPVVLTAGRALLGLAVAGGPLTLIIAAATAGYLVWQNWDKIGPTVGRMVTAVKGWLVDKLGGIFTWVGDKVKWVADKFKWLDDVVVRHSYVPDMIDSIADEMQRLDTVMVAKVGKATEQTADHFRNMAAEVQPLMDRLFPEEAAANSFRGDMRKIAGAEGAGLIGSETAFEARRRLVDSTPNASAGDRASYGTMVAPVADLGGAPRSMAELLPAGGGGGLSGLERAAATMAKLQSGFDALGGKAASTFAQITQLVQSQVAPAADQAGQAFGTWADRIAGAQNAVTGLMQKIFGKQAGGVIGGVLNIGLALAGKRALGGPVDAGKAYLVGERGPELFAPGSSGAIVPNHKLGGGSSSPITFDMRGAVVTKDLLTQVNMMAASHAHIAVAEGFTRFKRSQGRRLA